MADGIAPVFGALLAVSLLGTLVFGLPLLWRRLRHQWHRWSHRHRGSHTTY
jgi:hypothetical protein